METELDCFRSSWQMSSTENLPTRCCSMWACVSACMTSWRLGNPLCFQVSRCRLEYKSSYNGYDGITFLAQNEFRQNWPQSTIQVMEPLTRESSLGCSYSGPTWRRLSWARSRTAAKKGSTSASSSSTTSWSPRTVSSTRPDTTTASPSGSGSILSRMTSTTTSTWTPGNKSGDQEVAWHVCIFYMKLRSADMKRFVLIHIVSSHHHCLIFIKYIYEPNAVCWPISPTKCHFS